jgi:hypothetical protein
MSAFDTANETLLVDASAPAQPDAGDLTAWAADQRIFVSSVMEGMAGERAAAVGAIEAVGAAPVRFESFGGMDDHPGQAYLAQVRSSDIYIGILGQGYGTPLSTGYSATHAEYNEAEAQGLRVSVWATSGAMDGPQRDFRDAVRVFHVTGTYDSPKTLRAGVERRLRDLAAEALSPWVKIGNVVVRACDIHNDGQTIELTATVRDRAVAAKLESFRPDQFHRTKELPITWVGQSHYAKIEKVSVRSSSSRSRHVTIAARAVEQPHSSFDDIGTSGYSAEDLVEVAVRVALLGESNPLVGLEFLAKAENPLPQLYDLGLSEDTFASLAELLITEELGKRRGVERVTACHIGPVDRVGRRRIRLAWMPIQRYSNVQQLERAVEGDLAL